jgi:hypothetical protein
MTNKNDIAVPDSHPVGKISCLNSPIMGPVIAALFVSLMSSTVLAVDPEADVVDLTVESPPAAGPIVGTTQASSKSAVIIPAANALSDHTHLAAASKELEVIGRNVKPVSTMRKEDAPGLPYALILALVALIGLVPVSRSRP